MKLTLKFAAMGVLLLLAGACSNDDPVARSVIPEDDPITRILHKYLNADQTTRSTLDDFKITNVERHSYTLSENGVIATEATRTVGEEFEVARADFESNGKSGYAYLTTHPEAEGVYFFTDNGTINDTVQNKVLAAFVEAVPTAVGETITNGTPTIGDSPIGAMAYGPLLTTTWNQKAPFNNLCPPCYCSSCNGKRTLAGCGAIATAQVIAYCRRFTGTYYGNGTMVFNTLTDPNINWYTTADAVQKRLAAFIHEVAIGIETKFGHDGSSSQIKATLNYLRDLGYTCELADGNFDQARLAKSFMGASPFVKKAPVIVRGSLRNGEGHRWVIDGVKSSNPVEFHMNWGWGGYSDGWAASPLLTASKEGDFLIDNAAIYITNY